MQIVSCDESWRSRWNAYVDASVEASFYHRFEWRSVNHECFRHPTAYLAAVEGGALVGIFPLVQVKSRLFGNIACSLPFVNYGGPCADRPDIQTALLDAGRVTADTWGVEYVEIRSRRHLGDGLPASEHKVSMTLGLEPDANKIWDGFSSGHRQSIRKGYKNGFTARFGGAELLDDFFIVFSETWRDLGTPTYSKRYFEKIVSVFGPDLRLAVVYHDQEPAAAAFDGLHQGTVEGMWLGIRTKHRNQLAGYVLYWELIKNACERGYQRFHLGRSTAESGAEMFKKKWNAQTEPLYWHYILRSRRDIPLLNVNNPKYRLAISTWQRLPVALTQVVGPFIARSIP